MTEKERDRETVRFKGRKEVTDKENGDMMEGKLEKKHIHLENM